MSEVVSQELVPTNSSVSTIINEDELDKLSIDQILSKCENNEDMSNVPYDNIRNNAKIFLIYYAKSQLRRVIKLTDNLEKLEDKLIESATYVSDPEVLMRIISTIQGSLSSAISLIDKVSTNDNYVKFVFNDNRKFINNIVGDSAINSVGQVSLNKESRNKIRELASDLLTHFEEVQSIEGEVINE